MNRGRETREGRIPGPRARFVHALLAALACASSGAFADEAPSSAFVRSRSVDGCTTFETATRTYRRADGTGPVVSLVGVVHIGDRAYYDALVDELGRSQVVLFESVLPRGAFGTRGADDLERQRRTQDAMLFLRGLAERFARSNARFPETLDELRAYIVERDTRLAKPFDLATVDGWGRPLGYARRGDAGFAFASLGADGRNGGCDAGLDLVLGPRERFVPSVDAKADDRRDLYREFADALGVDLQVRSIDYDRDGWIPADLPMEELLDRLWKRGERSVTIEMLSNDGGLQQGLVRFLLSFVSKSTAFKKMVVQALGQAGDGRRGEGLGDTDRRLIIDERNDAVVEELRHQLALPEAPASVAIFYGAAHMPDFESTLRDEFGLVADEGRWFPAMKVDEWEPSQIKNRIERFEKARDGVLSRDPQGAFPEVARIDARLAELRRRAERAAAAPATADGGS